MAASSLLRSTKQFIKRRYHELALGALERSPPKGFSGQIIETAANARRRPNASPADVTDRATYDPVRAYRTTSEIRNRAAEIERTAGLLADEASRELYRSLLAFRIVGSRHMRLPKADVLAQQLEAAAQVFQGKSERVFPPFEVGRYTPEFEGQSLDVECWHHNVCASFIEKQYYFLRGNVRIQPEPGDVVLDCGACFGDTALGFAVSVGKSGQVHSLEPIDSQREIFERNLAQNPDIADRVRIHPFALDEVSGKELFFSAGASARKAKTGFKVTTITLDDLVARAGIAKVDYIKMDIEGAEPAAIRGAAETIRKHKPKLGISIYHSVGDMILIPQLIKDIEPSYELYIDHHTAFARETILYAEARR